MSPRHPYHCGVAKTTIWQLHELLWRARVLAGQPFKDRVARLVRPCSSCDAHGQSKRCTGWTLTIDRDSALSFKPAKVRGRLVRAELQAQASHERSQPAVAEDWQRTPALNSTVTVELFDVADERLLARHHLDLSTRSQPGPVWHIQSGGNPAGEHELTDSWLDVPRWPLPPGDVVLAAELLVFNLHPDSWRKMQSDGAWLRLVQSSEDLMINHYLQRIQTHFLRSAPNRDLTWLAAQDNAGDWDPRPLS